MDLGGSHGPQQPDRGAGRAFSAAGAAYGSLRSLALGYCMSGLRP